MKKVGMLFVICLLFFSGCTNSGWVQGISIRIENEAQAKDALKELQNVMADALTEQFGGGDIDDERMNILQERGSVLMDVLYDYHQGDENMGLGIEPLPTKDGGSSIHAPSLEEELENQQ